MTIIPFTVLEQGCVQINEAVIITKSENIVAIEIDFATKRHKLIGTDISKLTFCMEDFDAPLTVITFPEFKDWKVFCFECFRYTCQLCLIKRHCGITRNFG